MAKKKTKTEPEKVENLPVEVPVVDESLSLFDQASLEVQKKRHETINKLFDDAATVLSEVLNNPEIDGATKMFPAKLAVDIFMMDQKFEREDRRIDIEEQKLDIERTKLKMTPQLGGGTFNQQNNLFLGGDQSNQPVDLAEIKKKQEEMLSAYREKSNKSD